LVAEDAHQRGFARIEEGTPDGLHGLGEPTVAIHDEEARTELGQSFEESAAGTQGLGAVVAVGNGETETAAVACEVFNLLTEKSAA
jgi:hypothetical protein